MLGTIEERACKDAIIFRLYGVRSRIFFLNKEMAGPNTYLILICITN